MKLILLTQGKFAQVDDEDYVRVMQYKWQAIKPVRIWYAKRAYRVGKKVKAEYMHNFILGIKYVDHIDGNGLNNQRSNLRSATNSLNQANSKRQDGRSSAFKGVTKRGDRRPAGLRREFEASIRVNGKLLYLGKYKTENEAAEAYDRAAKEHFGEYSKTNF